MDPLLESPPLRVAGAALATAVSVSALAHVTRKWGKGAWATTSALLIGADDPTKGDLRFAAVCSALGAGLSWVVALDSQLRELPPTARALALVAGLPSMALLVSGLADMLAANEAEREAAEAAVPVPVTVGAGASSAADADLRARAAGIARQAGFTQGQSEAIGTAVRAGELALGAAATVATNPTVRACAGAVSGAALEAGKTALAAATSALRKKKTPAELRAMIELAAAGVAASRARTEDEATREALASMEEALGSYAQVVEDPEADLDRIERAVREVATLARRCEEDEGAEAFQALGLRRDASLDDAKRVYRELARIYHADACVDGVDPEKFVELTAAYERVRAYLNDPSKEPR